MTSLITSPTLKVAPDAGSHKGTSPDKPPVVTGDKPMRL